MDCVSNPINVVWNTSRQPLFINDLPDCVKNANVVFYADDCNGQAAMRSVIEAFLFDLRIPKSKTPNS